MVTLPPVDTTSGDAATVFASPTPVATSRPNQATTFDMATLAGLSVVDLIQTERYLHKDHGEDILPLQHDRPVYEADPILGKHPTLLRMVITGAVVDFGVLHIRSPFLRRFAIGLEAANVVRNFTIGMKL